MEEKNKYDRLIEQLKNNIWVAITLVVFICIAAILNILVDFKSLLRTENNSKNPIVYNDNRTYADNSKNPVVNNDDNSVQSNNSEKTNTYVENDVINELENNKSQPIKDIKSNVYRFPFQVDNDVKNHFNSKYNIIIQYVENEQLILILDELIENIPNSNRYRLIGGHPVIILNNDKCNSTILLKPDYYYGLPKQILTEKIRKEYIDSLSRNPNLFIKEIEQCVNI